ncbi:hypothetical protein HW555_011244 [Spodoptera exigua]|uniref:Uncharacterized protein n=1 Tax=Spodoptera exigua TaxID=7107 RepID=A0A835G819_SPOEX|nr:hypothetical protein HW555_011244 [Spodoptera exigua]
MAYPIKYLSLQKSELEYEVAVRGETPANTVAELRRQICKLSQVFLSEDILCSHLDPLDDLNSCLEILNKIKDSLEVDTPDKNVLGRIENLFHHLYHRLNRICRDDKFMDVHTECTNMFREYYEALSSLKARSIDPLISIPHSDAQVKPEKLNISVTCEGNVKSSELAKLKYDGKSCVRAFIQRVSEFSVARNITNAKLLSFATEIFVDDALHWFRSVKHQVSSWEELVVLLQQDFDKADYDYLLLSEIRSRTQGAKENITIYLSIISGMFSRLSRSLVEEDKLEIILHNIRPCYASTLASASQITSIDQLRMICRNYENVQSRMAQFREPSAATSDTLAPEFAYKQRTDLASKQNYNNNHKLEFNKTNSNNSKQNFNNNVNEKYLHALNTDSAPGGKLPYCPRCRNNSHSLRDCQNKEIMCFKCGQKGVKKPDCPNCNKVQIPKN